MAGPQRVNKKLKCPVFTPKQVILGLQYIFQTREEDYGEKKVFGSNLVNPLNPRPVHIRTLHQIFLHISKCNFKPLLDLFRSNNYDIRF